MLNKVKKIRDKLFSGSINRREGEDEDDGGVGMEAMQRTSPAQPGPRYGAAPANGIRRYNSRDAPSVHDQQALPVHSLHAMHSNNSSSNSRSGALVPTTRRNSVNMKEAPHMRDLMEAHSPHSPRQSPRPSLAQRQAMGLELPPVGSGNNSLNNSFTVQQARLAGGAGVPYNLGSLLSPAGSNGRRKSTPAALDMALRTAEGKAAVEELLTGQGTGSRKLLFPQYFSGAAVASKEAEAVQKMVPKPGPPSAGPSRLAPSVAGPANRPPGLPLLQVPAGPPPAAPGSSASRQGSEKTMSAVPEDACMEDAGAGAGPMMMYSAASPSASPQAAGLGARVLKKASATDSASSLGAMPNSPSGLKPHPPPPVYSVPLPAASPTLQQPALSPTPPPVPPPSQPPLQQVPQSTASAAEGLGAGLGSGQGQGTGRATKLLTLSAQLPVSMQRKHWCLADYNIVRKMYTGYASTVYQAMCKKSLEMVALKVYHMDNLCELNHYQVFREIRVHQGLQHLHIINLFASFQEASDVVLVQEYAEGGDLYRLLHKAGGRLSERQAVEMVLHPFLLALHFLHTRGIMHRDIKPENVLFTEQRVLKLADFGLAIDLNEERAVTRAGTLDYMAPEVLRCPPKNLPQENKNNPYLHYNNSVDAWAVGVFAYELVVGFPPFAGETQMDAVDKIMHLTVPEFPEKLSELAKDFITAALRKHPGDRPTVMEMLHHPWVRLYQRRTSMRLNVGARRRSSVMYAPASYTPPQESAEEGTDGPPGAPGGERDTDMADADVDINEMTPEQIEAMIRKLQVAKAAAEMRDSGQMEAVAGVR